MVLCWYRTLEWRTEGICKRIPDFHSYLESQHKSFAGIAKAYEASKEAAEAARLHGQQPCLISSVHGPCELNGCYKVTIAPHGFLPTVKNEEVQQASTQKPLQVNLGMFVALLGMRIMTCDKLESCSS